MAGEYNPELVERLHKWQKSLASTGQSTELLGWALVAVTPALLLLQQKPNPAVVIGIWIIAVLGGLYYIYSGRYIRYTHGKYTTKFLVLNGLVTILIAQGIIPIIVLIENWVTYFKYPNENKRLKSKPIGNKEKPFTTDQKVLLALFITAGLASVIYISHRYNATTTASDSSASTQAQPYTSAEDNFVINFSGIPSVTHSTVPVNEDKVPQTTYEKDLNSGNTIYYVAVTKYPSSYQFSDIKGGLEGAANGEVQGTQGAKMVSSKFITFLGADALDTEYTAPTNGTTYTVYSRNLIKGKTLYTIFTVGETQENFNNFANSFNFTQ